MEHKGYEVNYVSNFTDAVSYTHLYSPSINHEWNMAYFGGEWHLLDLTWDSSNKYYGSSGKGEDVLNQDPGYTYSVSYTHLGNLYKEDLRQQKQKTKVLEQYSRDMTKLAAEGKLDPVIGRDQEILRLVQILSLIHILWFPKQKHQRDIVMPQM